MWNRLSYKMTQNNSNIDREFKDKITHGLESMQTASEYTTSEMRSDIEDQIEYTTKVVSVSWDDVSHTRRPEDREKAHSYLSEAFQSIGEAERIARRKDDMNTVFRITAVLDGLSEIESQLRQNIINSPVQSQNVRDEYIME